MNRKQRRAAASKRGQKRMKKQLSPQEMMQEKLERVQRLVAGKAEPPNEFVAYLVQQIQQASAEADQVQKGLQQHREATIQLENRAKELRGIINKYVKDVQQWDKPENVLAMEKAQRADGNADKSVKKAEENVEAEPVSEQTSPAEPKEQESNDD